MILTADYHTHTPYSHGKGTVLQNAEKAKALGLKELGITDHGFSHIAFGLRKKKLAALRQECRQAEEKTGVKVLVGMEANILGESGKCDLRPENYDDFDLFLAGKHVFVAYENLSAWVKYCAGNYLTDKLRLKPSASLQNLCTKAYIQTIKNNPVDVITHVNYLNFADSLEVAKCASDFGTYIEINTKKTHLSDEEWQTLIDKTSCRFLVNSDAHAPQRVGDTALADALFSRIDFPTDRVDNVEGRVMKSRFLEYKTHR